MAWSDEYFRQNRKKLSQEISGGLLVVAANRQMQRRNDMTFPFSQDGNFWYLCGINHPDWILIYDGARDHSWIVQPELSDTEKVFEGVYDAETIIKASGADELVAANDFEQLLRSLSRKHSAVYTALQADGVLAERVVVNPAQKQLNTVLSRIFSSVIDCRKDIARLRAIKSEPELKAIGRAIDITVDGFRSIREQLDELQYEYEAEALLSLAFRKSGARHAYDPIVASAKNACTLHYTDNSQPIRKGSAVLIDAGAEFDGYCADITRTYVRGSATKRYQQLHAAMQLAHQQIIDLIEPHMPIADYLRQVDDIMQAMLVDVGLLRSPSDDRYRQYFPHAISHGLGVDVHDSLGGRRTLDPGMVLTVEPGVYIPEESIGIRLEDDIAVTKTGHLNLSGDLSTDYR